MPFAVSDANIVAGTDTSGVFVSTDNGATWEMISIPDMGRKVFALAVINFTAASLPQPTGEYTARLPTARTGFLPAPA